MKTQVNDVFKIQQNKLVRATFKKGSISAINLTTSTVDVYLFGNNQTAIKNIPLASGIPIQALKVGDRCKLDCFDENNPNDMVVAYIYGRPLSYIKSGTFLVTTTGGAITHNLGTVPNFVSFIKTQNPSSGSTETIDVYQYQPADQNNIYLKSVYGNMNIIWYVGLL